MKSMWQNFMLLPGLLLAVSFPLQAQWSLQREQNGIKVYTAPSAISPVNAVKVEALLDGSCQKLVAILKDVEKQKQWVYATRQAYLIKQLSDTELLYYVEIALPWPARNRDAAIHMTIEEDQADKTIKILTTGEPKAIPKNSGKVRVPVFKAVWEAKAADKGQIQITYVVELDPGGNLPAGVINLFVTKGPYETFINLARLLEK